ncbi:hypothetical protein SXIM_03270 [Streptomyces xiamenensis]|uniref:Uncharacterized protein n=1 Tax=Streptomyces xiamenensis TaxID=408015 RepID=A0A0F7CMT3_9ACTN|nr:hypothetical protein SXIM_03270 [Streptomyces xiamenensis]
MTNALHVAWVTLLDRIVHAKGRVPLRTPRGSTPVRTVD